MFFRCASATTRAAGAALMLLGMTGLATAQDVVIPANTEVVVLTGQSIDSTKADLSRQYSAKLDEPITVNGRQVAPKGAPAAVMIDDASQAGVAGRASLSLRLAWVTVNGERLTITSGQVTSESNSQKGRTGKGAIIGGAAGVVIGGLLGGGKGAVRGGVAGGAVGASVAVLNGEKVSVPTETRLTFTLAQDAIRQLSGGRPVATGDPSAGQTPVVVATAEGIRFDFGSAAADGSAIKVVVYATNQGLDRNIQMPPNNGYGDLVILIDDAGNRYVPAEVMIGNQQNRSDIVNGVRTPITLNFTGLPTMAGKVQSKSIRRLTLTPHLRGADNKEQIGKVELQFLPIESGDAPSAPVTTDGSQAGPAPGGASAAPVTVASANSIRYEFGSAAVSGNAIKVVIYATNQGMDRAVRMPPHDGYAPQVTLIDDAGNSYVPAEVIIGNQPNTSEVVNGVRTAITLNFTGLPTMGGKVQSKSIRRLTLTPRVRESNQEQTGKVEFQFLPLSGI